jgi:hypothetical protein
MPAEPSNYWQVDTDVVAAASIDNDPRALPVTPEQPMAVRVGMAATFPSDADIPTTGPLESTTLSGVQDPVRIVVTGDSTGEALGTGVLLWAADHPLLARAEVRAAPGCGFVMGGERRWGDDIMSTDDCDGWPADQLYPLVQQSRPDIVAVMTSTWDIIDQRWDGEELLAPSDPEYRARLIGAYTDLVDNLTWSGAARVALVLEPVPNVWWNNSSEAEGDPARHAVLAGVYREVAAAASGSVEVIDMASWFSSSGLDGSRDARPDGIHLAPAAASSIVDRFLGERLIAAARD